MLDWKPLCNRKKRHFKSSLMRLRTPRASRLSLSLLKSLKSLCDSSGRLSRRIKGEEFTKVQDDDATLIFLTDLGYKGPLHKYTNMYVDHMHHPWRNLATIINKCFSGETASNDRLRKSRIDILWGMFYRENIDYPELIWEDFAFQIDHKKERKSRRETMPFPRFTKVIINHFLSQHKSLSNLKYQHYHTIKDNDVALELGKSISVTEAEEEEAARQVHATHARIVTESKPEPTKKKTGSKSTRSVVIQDTPNAPKPKPVALKPNLKGVQSLTPEEQEVVDTMQALKESKKTSRRQLCTGCSSEGTSRIPRVPDESTIISATSSEGIVTISGVPDEEKVKLEEKVILEWGSEQESEYSEEDQGGDKEVDWISTDEEEEKKDDTDDDKSIDLEMTDDEETDDEFVQGAEEVNDDEDEEMTNAEVEESRTVMNKILMWQRRMLERLNNTVKDTTDAEINSLLDIKIQSEVPLAPVTTLPPPSVSTIPPVPHQTIAQIPTPPITTDTPTITTAVSKSDALSVVQLRVVLQRHTVELIQKYSVKPALESSKIQTPTINLEQEYEKSASEILKIKKEQAEK
ncbi:hypothetical protein Tco_1043193 [Tanacetum coccineum]|uniref:Uncharacterized protein n=1 Tax=Tanacetum coccineum TaxID=301880 RepID=A0ABQ5GLB7_9ASTR